MHVPIHRGSAMNANLLLGPTSIQSFPNLTTGHDFLHSWLHFLGLHFWEFTMAIRVNAPSPLSFLSVPFFFGGILIRFYSIPSIRLVAFFIVFSSKFSHRTMLSLFPCDGVIVCQHNQPLCNKNTVLGTRTSDIKFTVELHFRLPHFPYKIIVRRCTK